MNESNNRTPGPTSTGTAKLLTYPAAYKPRSIREQIYILRLMFPEMRMHKDDVWNAECLANRPPPDGAEAWFAVPVWQRIAPTYEQALVKMLKALARGREVREADIEWLPADLGSRKLRKNENSAKLLKLLYDRQEAPDGILVIPAQLGLLYQRMEIKQVQAAFRENEFHLDAFTVASILLTHPERLDDDDIFGSLWIHAAGDEVSVEEDPLEFRFGMGFGFGGADDVMTLSPEEPDEHDGMSAFATGFVPEALEDSETP